MRPVSLARLGGLALALLLAFASGGLPADTRKAPQEEWLRRNPYDYAARRDLCAAYAESGNHAQACYHAAWLTWLAPRIYAESQAEAGTLHSQEAQDGAVRRARAGPVLAAACAVRAKALLLRACLNGTIAQQASRLRREISDLLAEAELASGEQGTKPDPLARIALAQIGLTLDDALALEDAPGSRELRADVLRTAASRAADVTTWLPDSPGAHRTLAVIRARQADLSAEASAKAELDNSWPGRRPELWDLAIAEAERAHQLDPDDTSLAAMLWTLHLRAGNWSEAKNWQQLSGAGQPSPGDVAGSAQTARRSERPAEPAEK